MGYTVSNSISFTSVTKSLTIKQEQKVLQDEVLKGRVILETVFSSGLLITKIKTLLVVNSTQNEFEIQAEGEKKILGTVFIFYLSKLKETRG